MGWQPGPCQKISSRNSASQPQRGAVKRRPSEPFNLKTRPARPARLFGKIFQALTRIKDLAKKLMRSLTKLKSLPGFKAPSASFAGKLCTKRNERRGGIAKRSKDLGVWARVVIFTDIYRPAAGCSSTHTNNSPWMREEANGSSCKSGFLDCGSRQVTSHK